MPVIYQVKHDSYLSTLTSGTGLLGYASDPEDFPLTASPVSSVSHGTLVLLPDGAFLYQPAAGFIGTDAFTYQVSNGWSSSSSCATWAASES